MIRRGVKLAEQVRRPDALSPSFGKKWYEGGTLHYKTVREWRRGSRADKLATCADCLALLSAERVLDPRRFRFTNPDAVRPYAEQMVALVDAATARRFVTIDGERMAVYESKKVYEVISMVVIGNGWHRR